VSGYMVIVDEVYLAGICSSGGLTGSRGERKFVVESCRGGASRDKTLLERGRGQISPNKSLRQVLPLSSLPGYCLPRKPWASLVCVTSISLWGKSGAVTSSVTITASPWPPFFQSVQKGRPRPRRDLR